MGVYQPHYSGGHRSSNAEYGLMRASNTVESSFDSRTPINTASANYSNVQIVCRINGPLKSA